MLLHVHERLLSNMVSVEPKAINQYHTVTTLYIILYIRGGLR